MDIIKLTFISLQKSSHIAFPNEEIPYHVFLSLFEKRYHEKEEMWVLEAVQQNTPYFLQSLKDFVQEHQNEHPQFHEVLRFFARLTTNHYFLIHKGILTDTAIIHQYWDFLAKKHQSAGIAYENYQDGLLPPAVFSSYNLNVYGQHYLKIGQPVRSLRICRFCQSKQGERNKFGHEVSFKNKAHAISEALGNKTTVLLEECDACNERFSTGIEPSLIQYLSPYRSLFGLDGKGGKKKLKGLDFSMRSDTKTVSIKLEKDVPALTDAVEPKSFKVDLNLREGFIPQDVYKSLCKFVISVIPSSACVDFEETVNWINGDWNEKKLPKIALLQDNQFFTDTSLLLTYTRKDENLSLPYMIGEFHYAHNVFVFIVPFSAKDNQKFVKANAYQHYWSSFNTMRKGRKWKFIDFSVTTQIKLQINFEIKIPKEK
ncbi:hypothetical protein IM792_14720 [Mucilaginibacter sp. JRF]|uniref:hypothetical protein n=1 Tax=Mucilaginibacter sp. JRF TaxID=2780088 RepID=UPI00187EC447|nr:hypothetical protein [Mucilaginibacter sp. JRF]MBE9585707.1 hypothetical protein [Mucilaginibacter sp. JRF]